MLHRINDLWVHNRKLLIIFAAMLAVAGFFGIQSARQFIYWSDPAKQDQTLAGWMTPRYVSRSYRVPPEVVKTAFGIEPDMRLPRVSLETLAAQHGLTLAQMEERLVGTVEAWRMLQAGADQ